MARALASILAPFFGALPLLGAMTACTGSSDTTVVTPTLITVRPEQFAGPVRCRPGELRSYVVQLTNIDVDAGQPALLSLPTPCTQAVSFGVPPLRFDNSYTGVIYGYDVEADPDAGVVFGADGTPVAVSASTGLPVAPRWTTTCGVPPVVAPGNEAGADQLDGGATDAGTLEAASADAEDQADGAASPDGQGATDAAASTLADSALTNALFTPTRVYSYVEMNLLGCIPFQAQRGSAVADAATDALPDGAMDVSSPSPGADTGTTEDAAIDARTDGQDAQQAQDAPAAADAGAADAADSGADSEFDGDSAELPDAGDASNEGGA